MKKFFVMMAVCCSFFLFSGNANAADSTVMWQYKNTVVQFANPFTDQLLYALTIGDYDRFQSNISSKMKTAMPASAFNTMASTLKGRYGTFQRKEVIGVELLENYIVVNYKGFFSKQTDPILMRVTLELDNGKTRVGGLWFNEFSH